MRLFVAAWPTGLVRRALAAIEIPKLDSVRWEEARHWHVTLSFLGSVPDSEFDALLAALEPLSSEAPSVAVVGPATETLGRGVLCVPVSGLSELAEAVRTATLPFNRSEDPDRPFYGHLTLARARRGKGVPRPVVGVPVEVAWRVEEVRLVSSSTGPANSRYEPMTSVALSGPGPA